MSYYNPGIEPVPSDELPPDFPLPAVPDQAEGAPFHCAHPDSVFSRTVCPEPCGMMHTYCATCGSCLDSCPHGPLTAAEPGEESTAPRVCSKCDTAGCLEDRESGWYEDDDPPSASPPHQPSHEPGTVTVDHEADMACIYLRRVGPGEIARTEVVRPHLLVNYNVAGEVADVEILTLRMFQAEPVPEVECPSCGITIRARMADAPGHVHIWVRCPECPSSEGPCACSGGVCCEGEQLEFELEVERDAARAALTELIRLKDGPRDAAYERDKATAWAKARAVLRAVSDGEEFSRRIDGQEGQ